MSSDLLLEDQQVTKTWLQDVIEEKTGKRPQIKEVSSLAGAENGFMSVIRRVHLQWDVKDTEAEHLPESVVVKIASADRGGDAIKGAAENTEGIDERNAIMQRWMHNTECRYYNIFKKAPSKPFNVPTIYSAVETTDGDVPIIVMEYFGDSRLVDLIDGFDEKQLYAIVDEIVDIHVYSHTNEEWRHILPDPDQLQMRDEFFALIKDISQKLAYHPMLSNIAEFNEKVFSENSHIMERIIAETDAYEKKEKRGVLVHGDLWAPQILWKSTDKIAGVIDWQIAHEGSPADDLLHVLSTCVSVENRRALQKPLIDYYHNKLTEKLQQKGVAVPYTLEQLEEEYRMTMAFSCMLTIFANGFWSNSPVLQKDGQPDIERITESFTRCRAFVEDTLKTIH